MSYDHDDRRALEREEEDRVLKRIAQRSKGLPTPSPTVEKPAPSAQPGCCGPVTSRIKLIKEVHAAMAYGHLNLAVMYESLIADYPADEAALRAAANGHRSMAEVSKHVTIPDGYIE